MNGVTPMQGALLAFVAYASLAFGDALIKGIGSRLSVFEIGFFAACSGTLAILFMRPGGERWSDFFRLRHPWLVQARCATGLGAGLLGVYAFTTIPFAEAYTLIFLAPFVVILLSILLLGERVGWVGWLAVAAGLLGALLVIRPGVKALEWGHLAAFGVAMLSGMTVIILRRIAGAERRISLLGMPYFYAVILFGLAMIPDFRTPSPVEFALMAGAGLLSASGQLALLTAAKYAPASVVGQAQYSQLLWAVLIGAVIYAEYPDALAIAGLAVIAAAGILNVLRSRRIAAPPAAIR
ncbi:DMT family transporter [Chelativorans sp.]|uniref:DMT family transporter n=1 Tax=Chelativorans sp. TaxID=2203393 RepID=UPI00281217D3|nr:DMT family transporter [Chelativorans sp.]